MASRIQKQLIIGGVYFFIVAAIVGGTLYSEYRPICSDGIKNGKEEGVDCGTLACGKACVSPIQAIQVQSVNMVQTPAGDHDVAILTYNPNVDYGVSRGTYEITVDGQTSAHDFYMLPGQSKYIVLTSLRGVSDANPTVEIKSVEWVKAPTQDNPFLVTQDALTPGGNQTTFEAVIVNNSHFDFDNVDISAVVLDLNGNVITTNTTNIQTFLSATNRSIKMTWPFSMARDVRIQVEANTNLFNDANFLKRNGTLEKFQQYY